LLKKRPKKQSVTCHGLSRLPELRNLSKYAFVTVSRLSRPNSRCPGGESHRPIAVPWSRLRKACHDRHGCHVSFLRRSCFGLCHLCPLSHHVLSSTFSTSLDFSRLLSASLWRSGLLSGGRKVTRASRIPWSVVR